MERRCAEEKIEGIISRNYVPRDDSDIQKGERAFYTHENALLIDTYRVLIDEVVENDALKKFFLAPLVTEASIHVNTSGVFKGFYKDKKTGIGCFVAAERSPRSARASRALSRTISTTNPPPMLLLTVIRRVVLQRERHKIGSRKKRASRH